MKKIYGTESHEFMRLVAERKKRPAKWYEWFLRLLAFLVGVFFLVISLLFSLTIIGILIAGPITLSALALFSYTFNVGRDVECPNCQKKHVLLYKSDDFRCQRCKMPVIVEWK